MAHAYELTEAEGLLGRLDFRDFGQCARCGAFLSFFHALARPGACACGHREAHDNESEHA